MLLSSCAAAAAFSAFPQITVEPGVTRLQEDTVPADSSAQPQETLVYLINADEIRFSKRINPDAQVLVGNVTFRHDSMYMYCDSALFYQKDNSFDAYFNIRLEQGDTLAMYGDSLYYDGNTRIARVRDNVVLENRNMTLLTDSLNYDRNLNLGYFFDGGTLMDSLNTLTSDYGQYNTVTKFATFKDSVELQSPDYNIKSDTLIYNTEIYTAFIVSPARIVNGDNLIVTDRAVFNTNTNEGTLLDRSVVHHDNDARQITGDSLYYNDGDGIVKGFGNVIVQSFKDNADILGDYAFYDSNKDSAVVTGRAQAIEYSTPDSLFIHADTFKLVTRRDTCDSIVMRQIRAYNKVRSYRSDMQMVADSMVFNALDSCLTLYRDPILWSGNQQVLGETILFYMNDSTIDWAHIIGQALYVQQIDSIYYNQISGREMKAYFKNGNISRATVEGNVMVVYFPFDSDSIMIGMNTTEASNLTAYFEEKQIRQIVVHDRSNGVLYPMSQIPVGKDFLTNFGWFDRIRPFNRWDIFNWRGKMAGEQLKSTQNKKAPLPSLKNR